jgi:hypothetical protein
MSVTHRSFRKLIFNVLIDQTYFIEQIDISCFTTPQYRELTVCITHKIDLFEITENIVYEHL